MSLYTGALDHGLAPPRCGAQAWLCGSLWVVFEFVGGVCGAPPAVELNLLGERLVLQGSCAFFALFMVNIVSVLCTARCSVFLIWSS